MAVVTGGKSDSFVHLDYKCEFPVPNYTEWEVGEVVLSRTFSQNEDVWQLQFKKASDSKGFHLECILHLVTSSNDKKKVARMCHFLYGKMVNCSPTAVYCQDGDKCHPEKFWSIWFKHSSKYQKIIVEVLNNLELTETIEPPKSRMSAEVLKWFDSEDFGDLTIVAADEKKFRCQKEILARRSEVFRLMFSVKMKEERENVVNIEDFDEEIVAQLLVFVYTDDCQVGPIADRLYAAAHQYQLDRLKFLCESSMAHNLSANTIVTTFRLANFYHLDKLLASCVRFMDRHKAELSIRDLLVESMTIQEGNECEKEQD